MNGAWVLVIPRLCRAPACSLVDNGHPYHPLISFSKTFRAPFENLHPKAAAQRCSAKKLLKKFHTPNSLFNKFASQQVYYREALVEVFSGEFCEFFKSSFFIEPLVTSILFRILSSNKVLDLCLCFSDQGLASKKINK